jgi:hypothetical protein
VCVLHVAGIQVIEDTATVVQHVRKERGVPQSVPNIVIGGSYGKHYNSTGSSSINYSKSTSVNYSLLLCFNERCRQLFPFACACWQCHADTSMG